MIANQGPSQGINIRTATVIAPPGPGGFCFALTSDNERIFVHANNQRKPALGASGLEFSAIQEHKRLSAGEEIVFIRGDKGKNGGCRSANCWCLKAAWDNIAGQALQGKCQTSATETAPTVARTPGPVRLDTTASGDAKNEEVSIEELVLRAGGNNRRPHGSDRLHRRPSCA